jgi:hypothetical protein
LAVLERSLEDSRSHWGDLGVDGRMMLKWILMSFECRLLNGFDREQKASETCREVGAEECDWLKYEDLPKNFGNLTIKYSYCKS